jgi:hypothetical protein
MAGILNQLPVQPVQQQAQPQLTPEMVQAIIASQMQPVAMQGNFGANRFLTGNMALPMTFGVDVPAYTPFQMQPGSFQNFLAAGGGEKAPPIFNPATRTYTASKASE